MAKKTKKTKKAAKESAKAAGKSSEKRVANKSGKKDKAGKKGKPAKKAAHVIAVRKKLKIDSGGPGKVLESKVSYEGPLFRVLSERVQEPTGKVVHRDVIRHNGSAVILAIDKGKKKSDPVVLIERQFRHAAQQFLYEVPAGKMEAGEDHLEGAQRELLEETGYRAKKWTKLVKYFASPGFLGEWMQVFLAEDLTPGEARPEEDESFELQFVPLSELLRLIGDGKIRDGKTLISVLFYTRYLSEKRK
jgi:ADP-ribose pyrophosphatase